MRQVLHLLREGQLVPKLPFEVEADALAPT